MRMSYFLFNNEIEFKLVFGTNHFVMVAFPRSNNID